MSEVRFAVSDVARVRFAVSPLWETVASLGALAEPGRHAVHGPWLREARGLAQDPELARRTAPLRALIQSSGCLPDFLTPPPDGVVGAIEDELAVVAATPLERVRAELGDRQAEVVRAELSGRHAEQVRTEPGGRQPEQVRAELSGRHAEQVRTELGARHPEQLRAEPDGLRHPERILPLLVDAARAWWQAAIEPHWPRVRAVLEADIAHRTREFFIGGVQALVERLHPSARWAAGRLVADDGLDTSIDLAGRGLPMLPSVFASRGVLLTAHQDAPPLAIYPARAVGTLWERRPGTCRELERLLGRSRAAILALTAAPHTTTQLAARTGLSAGAVSQHLGVLRDAGLVRGHRFRHEVHYTASELGRALLNGR